MKPKRGMSTMLQVQVKFDSRSRSSDARSELEEPKDRQNGFNKIVYPEYMLYDQIIPKYEQQKALRIESK